MIGSIQKITLSFFRIELDCWFRTNSINNILGFLRTWKLKSDTSKFYNLKYFLFFTSWKKNDYDDDDNNDDTLTNIQILNLFLLIDIESVPLESFLYLQYFRSPMALVLEIMFYEL